MSLKFSIEIFVESDPKIDKNCDKVKQMRFHYTSEIQNLLWPYYIDAYFTQTMKYLQGNSKILLTTKELKNTFLGEYYADTQTKNIRETFSEISYT